MFKETASGRAPAILLSLLLAACGGGGGGTTHAQSSVGMPQGNAVTSGDGTQNGSSGSGGGTQQGGTFDNGNAQATANDARFNRPIGIAMDASGNAYVADSANYTIRKVSPSGVVTTLAGSPGVSGSADGIGAAAQFSGLQDIAVDATGNVYVIDNSAVRKITASGTVTTLAGIPGLTGYAEGAGAAARFNQPWGIAVDAAGNLYVADTQNYVVRRVTSTGVVSTLAGTAGMRGRADGSTASATFLNPRGVAIDPTGNLYVTDWYGPPAPNIPEGSTFVRRIGTDGTVSTLAGTMNGDTGPAQFMDTSAIAADASGNVYVAAMRKVQRITSTGAVSEVIGSGAPFESLEGLDVDAAGNLYVADASLHVIGRVTQTGDITVIAGEPGESGSSDTTVD